MVKFLLLSDNAGDVLSDPRFILHTESSHVDEMLKASVLTDGSYDALFFDARPLGKLVIINS